MSKREGKRVVSDASDIMGAVDPDAELAGQSSSRWLGVGFVLVIVGYFFPIFFIRTDSVYVGDSDVFLTVLTALSVLGWVCVAVGFVVLAKKVDALHRQHLSPQTSPPRQS